MKRQDVSQKIYLGQPNSTNKIEKDVDVVRMSKVQFGCIIDPLYTAVSLEDPD